MIRLTTERVQSTLDHPYVACCGGCGTRLYCALDHDDSTHGVHGRVRRDVHDLAAALLAARADLATERERCARLCDAAAARWSVRSHGATTNDDARRERSNEASALAAEIRGGDIAGCP